MTNKIQFEVWRTYNGNSDLLETFEEHEYDLAIAYLCKCKMRGFARFDIQVKR